MDKKETLFQQKLQIYSKSTIEKISSIATSEQALEKIVKLVEESVSEEEVLQKLSLIDFSKK